MLTEAEKKWAERKERSIKGKFHFTTREELFAPWSDLYGQKELERLKKATQDAYWSHWWKIAPRETASKQFEVYASDCKETDVAKVKHETIARFLIEAQPEYIARLIDHLEDLQDAVEFEARVAATIARAEFYRPCHSVDLEKCAYPVEGNCCICHLKYARLAVEEEMKKEK